MSAVLRAFFLVWFVNACVAQKNNVCKNFRDYYTINENRNCYFDLAAQAELPELVTTAGYPLETFNVQTSDGYILTTFRLPNDQARYPNANGNPVYIQHGILSNAANFVTLGNTSLVYVLWDAGYDVWVGNFRGSYYSEGHVNLTTFDKQYWDHSIDEMATIDMPLIMEMIARETGRRDTFYIGHSLGTTIGLMYAAEYPEHASKHIKMFMFLAPVYTLSNIPSPYGQFVGILPPLLKLSFDFDFIRLLSQSQPLRSVVQVVCLESPILLQVCAQLHNIFYGPITGVGAEKMPVYYNIVPGGTGLKVLTHAGALVKNGFRKYDYGLGNFEKYGTLLPPMYDIKKIQIPTYLMYGRDDWVASGKDAMNLYNTLLPEARYGIREINEHDFNHIDFVYGRRAKELVYDRIINIFDSFPNKT